MDLGVRNKVFVMVGGTGGMGYAAAQELAGEGAKLALVSRNAERGEARAKALADEHGVEVRMFTADAGKRGEVERAIGEAASAFGQINGLAVSSAGAFNQAVFADLTDDDWNDFFQDYLMSTVRACRAALPHIVAAGGGTIVNVSAYSIRNQKPSLAAYTAMKTAVSSVTKNIAVNYGAQNVRANTVCPGFIYTEAMDEMAAALSQKHGLPAEQALSKSMIEEWGMKVALNRVGRAKELGELIAFLLSERAAYVTGALINADGGTQF